MKVIVTDTESRKSYDVVNILKKKYEFKVIVAGGKNTNFQLPILYAQDVYFLSTESYKEFEENFLNILNDHENEDLVYLPVAEKTTKFLYYFVNKNEAPNLKYLLPSTEIFKMCSDKGAFQAFCEKKGFPVPKSIKPNQLEAFNRNFRPLIAKLHSSQGSVGLLNIEQKEDLKKLENVDLDQYVIQEKVVSEQKVSGAFFLCKKGRVYRAYTHDRLRTFPRDGGVTVYSQSGFNQDIVDIGADVLKALNWDGLAMIEFMKDAYSGEWKIIEINPRIWGSVLLSSFSGADLLKGYVDLCRSYPVKQQPVQKKFIRWLFPFDLLNFLKGNISLKTLLHWDLKNTCYINFTYSSWWSALAFMIYFTFNVHSIKRFLKKLTG